MPQKSILLFFLVTCSILMGDNAIKLRTAAFFPIADRMQSIYGHTLPVCELEATFAVTPQYQLWVNINGMHRRGHSEGLKHATSIAMRSVSTGLSLIGSVSPCLKMYLGIGYSLSATFIHNRFTDRRSYQKKYLSGFVAKSGLLCDISTAICLELFLDYLYLKPQFKTRSSLGGARLGCGIGYKY